MLQPLHQNGSQHMNFPQGFQPCGKADLYGNASGIPVFVGGVHHAGFHFDLAAVTPRSSIPKRTSAIPDSYVHPVGRKALLPREASETGAADVSRQPGMIASP